MLEGEDSINKLITFKPIEQIRKDIIKYTGIIMTDNAIIYLRSKFKNEILDLDTHENYLPVILEAYDEYQLSNITEEQRQHQEVMEYFATEVTSTLEGATRYYKLNEYYFEWNEFHRLEHPERENKIEEVAYNLIYNFEEAEVDTRKPYGEVRYIVTCKESISKQMVVMCYRYDKTHIRIITAWRL